MAVDLRRREPAGPEDGAQAGLLLVVEPREPRFEVNLQRTTTARLGRHAMARQRQNLVGLGLRDLDLCKWGRRKS